MYTLAFLSFMATFPVVFAASSPAIPTGISQGCTTFLTNLDSNTQLQSCLKSINTATSGFSSTSSTKSSSDISNALTALCSSTTTTSCSSSFFRTQLTNFYTACSDEIGGDNSDSTVQLIYDTLYTAVPFRQAVCTQDNGAYCVNTLLAPGVTTSITSLIQAAKSYLTSTLVVARGYRKRAPAPALIYPNSTTFSSTGLPFLFLTPSTTSSALCSVCAQKIMTGFVNFETAEPYASGINSSPMLGKQTALWSSMTSGCGGAFQGSIVANAGAGPTSAPSVVGSLSGAVTVRASAAGVALISLAGAYLTL